MCVMVTSCLHPERVPGEATETPAIECCACGTAKYRLTFYGNWSEKVHPKDYPSEFKPSAWTCICTIYCLYIVHILITKWSSLFVVYVPGCLLSTLLASLAKDTQPKSVALL